MRLRRMLQEEGFCHTQHATECPLMRAIPLLSSIIRLTMVVHPNIPCFPVDQCKECVSCATATPMTWAWLLLDMQGQMLCCVPRKSSRQRPRLPWKLHVGQTYDSPWPGMKRESAFMHSDARKGACKTSYCTWAWLISHLCEYRKSHCDDRLIC